MMKSILPIALAALAITFAGCSKPYTRPAGIRFGSTLKGNAKFNSDSLFDCWEKEIPVSNDSLFESITAYYTFTSKKAFRVKLVTSYENYDDIVLAIQKKNHILLEHDNDYSSPNAYWLSPDKRYFIAVHGWPPTDKSRGQCDLYFEDRKLSALSREEKKKYNSPEEVERREREDRLKRLEQDPEERRKAEDASKKFHDL